MFHEPINKLTPFYDLLSTSIYSELSTTMAMRINKIKDSKDVRKEDIIKEFDSWGLKGSLILTEILKDYKNILNNAVELINSMESKDNKEFLTKVYRIIEGNYNNLFFSR